MTIRVNTQLLILLHRMLKENAHYSPDAVITIRQTDCGLTSHHHQTGTGAPVITPYRPTGSGEMGEELGINPYYKSLWPLSE